MKKLLILIIIFSLPVFAYTKYNRDISKPVEAENEETISFQIKKGASIKEIAANLEEKELIHDEFTFYLYTKFNNLGEGVIAGRFILSQAMNYEEIVNTISDPSSAEFIITIQEGLRVIDIDDKLVDLGLIEPGEFEAAVENFNGWEYYSFLDQSIQKELKYPLEGYLYPDTYFLDPANFSPNDLIYLALDNFERKTAELLPLIKRNSIEDIITMASIIENEVFGAKDRGIVSGILWKRLESGWTIGADITLLYITEDRIITKEDLSIDSPYNTRKNLGLPPGPISNPSLESIQASMYPESTEYWFYLTTLDTGEVIYAKTNDEHNQNRAIYLQ